MAETAPVARWADVGAIRAPRGERAAVASQRVSRIRRALECARQSDFGQVTPVGTVRIAGWSSHFGGEDHFSTYWQSPQ